MKVNYTNLAGIRTTVTLQDELVDCWLMTRPKKIREMQRKQNYKMVLPHIREYIEQLPGVTTTIDETRTRTVQKWMLWDIQDALANPTQERML